MPSTSLSLLRRAHRLNLPQEYSPPFDVYSFLDFGPLEYRSAWDLQKELVIRRIEDHIPDTLLFLEHPPTVTRGRGLQGKGGASRMPFDPMTLPADTQYLEIDRGGDLTWHGPGQLVIYAICKLGDRHGLYPKQDISGFVRWLEAPWIEYLKQQGRPAFTKAGASGVFTRMADGTERKLGSVGIGIRKWVSWHGIALNIAVDPARFQGMSPCGFDPEMMTTFREQKLLLSLLEAQHWTLDFLRKYRPLHNVPEKGSN